MCFRGLKSALEGSADSTIEDAISWVVASGILRKSSTRWLCVLRSIHRQSFIHGSEDQHFLVLNIAGQAGEASVGSGGDSQTFPDQTRLTKNENLVERPVAF